MIRQQGTACHLIVIARIIFHTLKLLIISLTIAPPLYMLPFLFIFRRVQHPDDQWLNSSIT